MKPVRHPLKLVLPDLSTRRPPDHRFLTFLELYMNSLFVMGLPSVSCLEVVAVEDSQSVKPSNVLLKVAQIVRKYVSPQPGCNRPQHLMKSTTVTNFPNGVPGTYQDPVTKILSGVSCKVWSAFFQRQLRHDGMQFDSSNSFMCGQVLVAPLRWGSRKAGTSESFETWGKLCRLD